MILFREQDIINLNNHQSTLQLDYIKTSVKLSTANRTALVANESELA